MFNPYPQHEFSKFITGNLPEKKYESIVDCPCGYGYITSKVASSANAKQVIGADMEEECISRANRLYGKGTNGNLEFRESDIHRFLGTIDPADVYLLINSIFLLPEPEKVLESIHTKLKDDGLLFVIIPNVQSKNFLNFQKLDGQLNKLILTKEQAEAYFLKHGFKTQKIEPVTFSYFFGNKLLRFLWRFRDLYLSLTSPINKMLGKQSNYWGFVLSKA